MSLTVALQERRNTVTTAMRSLIDGASAESRDWTPDEQAKFDGMTAELDAIDKRVKAVLDAENRAKDVDAAFDAVKDKPVTGPKPDARNSELRALLLAQTPPGPDGVRSYMARPSGPVDFRALSKLTAAAGANTVPTSFYDRLVAHMIEVSGILKTTPTVLTTDSGEALQVPKTTAHSTASLIAEAGTITTSEPTFGQITLGSFKYALLMQTSRELVSDTGVDLEGYLAMQSGRALGNAFGAHAVTGTGTGQPRGVVTDATLGVTGGTGVAGAFTYDNLVDLHYSVIEPYRNSGSCSWLVRDASLGALRKLKDTQNRPLWEPSMQVGVPDSIFGKPVYTDPNVAAVALSAKSVLFGDFSQYMVRMVGGGVRFESSTEFAFNVDLITYRTILRADAALVDLTGAVKYFAGGAT